ncbi:hypothetical protein [Metabacillus idriensis]|uniref:hypothetical protein n=1 Tax=Metabacillus idriensis TaxID=324768 RepID=UPI00174B150B|nr:hypothetical protein [Metabacillus idriensis]
MIDYEHFYATVRKIYDAFKNLMNFIKRKWEAIKEFMDNHEPVYIQPEHPASKMKLNLKQLMNPQVIMRKPKFIRARTSC